MAGKLSGGGEVSRAHQLTCISQVLTGLLDLWLEKKDKVLIFSMSLKILGYINDLMTASSKDYKHLTLDGKTSPEERMKRVTQFNTDPDVFCFLISTRAGVSTTSPSGKHGQLTSSLIIRVSD